MEATRKICMPDYEDASDNEALLREAMSDDGQSPIIGVGRALRRNVAFSLSAEQPEHWIDIPLEAQLERDGVLLWRQKFSVKWVDLWFFNDQTAVLAFKAELIGDETNADSEDVPVLNMQELNEFNRYLRDPNYNRDPKSQLQVVNLASGEKHDWWKTLVFDRWLLSTGKKVEHGLSDESGEFLGIKLPRPLGKTASGGFNIGVLGRVSDGDSATERRDHYSRYAKLITMAQIPDLGTRISGTTEQGTASEVEFLWNAPVTDPPFDFSGHYESCVSGKRMDIFSAYHFATMEGYPTAGDYLLYDLATTGNVGGAAGFSGRGWQVSPEYLRELLGEGAIEIWEYWRGFALHDSLAVLATDKSMPMVPKKVNEKRHGSQLETRYYYLYVYLYHIQFRLNTLSSEIIDGDLVDLYKSRLIQNRFNQFRNQYWFRDLTVDFQGVYIADKLKKALRLDDAFQTVEEEIQDVASFIDEKLEKGKQALITLLLAVVTPVIYLLDVLGVKDVLVRYGETHRVESIATAVVVLILVAFVSLRFGPNINSSMFRLYNMVYNRGKQ